MYLTISPVSTLIIFRQRGYLAQVSNEEYPRNPSSETMVDINFMFLSLPLTITAQLGLQPEAFAPED